MKPPCCTGKCKVPIQSTLNFLRIISDENRLKIICLLNRGPRCVCEIWEDLKIPQNLASHHLKVLRNFKLLTSKKIGLKVIYKLNNRELSKYQKLLSHFLNPNHIQK